MLLSFSSFSYLLSLKVSFFLTHSRSFSLTLKFSFSFSLSDDLRKGLIALNPKLKEIKERRRRRHLLQFFSPLLERKISPPPGDKRRRKNLFSNEVASRLLRISGPNYKITSWNEPKLGLLGLGSLAHTLRLGLQGSGLKVSYLDFK